jgi:long-chain acyl-CoA synthetase
MYHSFAWTCAVLYTLLQGASMTILDAFAPKETIAAIREFKVTVFYGVPPMYNILARMASPEDLAGIRYYVSGGAALPQKIAEQFRNKFGTAILEGYGLSEASPVVSLNPMNRVKYGSIGKPLPDVEVKVVNSRAEELPLGEIGELVVRGPNVMQGYYHLTLETAHALRNGWLHTGDMAYQDTEGYFFIVDRLKDMIIVNGENVYPREVEEVLYTYPGIIETAVIGVPDDLRGEAVCAYVVLEEGKALDKKDLRDFLVPRLAAYKIPRDFIRLDGLPKNKTGKIMKRTLREQVLTEFSQQQTG